MRLRNRSSIVLLSALVVLPRISLADNAKSVNCNSGGDLQKAIDTAPTGAVIQVSGTCNKGPYFVFKDLSLIGTGGSAVLSASSGDRVLHVPFAP
jgi:hypothetical protein